MIITFDGPTASGKSTVAVHIAQKLGFFYINSGMLYRSLAYLLVQKCGYSEQQLLHVKEEDVRFCMNNNVFLYTYEQGRMRIAYQGQEITSFLKDATIDRDVSLISSQRVVRDAMLAKQHELAALHNIVTDGRDVGSQVFPNADLKFYLTATLAVRAARWRQDQELRGNQFTQEEAEARVQERDHRDVQRVISPLVVPEGAITIDSSGMTLDEVIAVVVSHITKIRSHS